MLPNAPSAPFFSRLASSPLLRGGLLLVLVLLVAQTPAFAQSGPSPQATMTTVKNIAVVFLRGLMAIGLIIALLKVAKNFLSGSPESLTSFLWLVGGLVIFFGWGYFFRTELGSTSVPSAAIGNIGNSNLNPAISSGAYQMAQGVLNTMLTTVVPLLLFTTIALTVVRGFISSGSVQFELGPIFRVMFLYIGLLSYNVLVPQVGNLIGGVAELIKQNAGQGSTSAYTVLNQLRADATSSPAPANTTPGTAGAGTQDSGGIMAALGDKIATSFAGLSDIFSPQKFLMGLATDFMTSIIQAIMEFVQSFLLAFLYVAGPVAIAFSFIPGFGGVAKSWLQSLIGIHMWSVAFQIIAGLFVYYSAHESALTHTSTGAQLANLTGIAQTKYAVACIVFILMYCMVPYMSSLIVGSSAADSFVSSAMRIGASVASGGAAGAGMAAGAASNAAGAVSNAAGAVGNAASGARSGASAAASQGAGVGQQMLAGVRGAFGGGGGGGGGGQAPPPMAGSSNDAAQNQSVRTTAAQGPMPKRLEAAKAATGGGGGSAQSVNAQNVASSAGANGGSTPGVSAPAPAPTMTAQVGAPAAATVQQAVASSGPSPAQTGGGGGFGTGGVTAAMRAKAPSIAIDPNQKPPTLSGSST